jgi:hypothetical protein
MAGLCERLGLGLLIRRSQQMADRQDYERLNAIDLKKREMAAIILPRTTRQTM